MSWEAPKHHPVGEEHPKRPKGRVCSIAQPDGPSGERYLQLSMNLDALLVLGNTEVLAGQPDLPAGDSHSERVILDFKML